MSTVKITITPPLDCGKCDQVLLRLENPLLLAANIGLPPEDYRYFLEGEIVDVTMVSANVFEYTIEYDETLLADPEGGLEEVEVREVCCIGCLYEWLQGQALCELLQGAPSDCFEGISLLTLSADAGPLETLSGGDELRIFGGASLLTTTSNPDTVTIELVLSGDVDQILTFGTDGNIYLDCPTVLGCINVQNPITGDGSAGSPFGIAISADPGNDLELRLDGLYVADTVLSCTDVRACIFVANPISGDGSGGAPFTVDISADAFNTLELRVDGLYVPNVDTVLTCPQVLACINVANPISGDGSGGDPFTVDLSADAGNFLELRVDGLYVTDTGMSVVTQNPISGDGTVGSPIGLDLSANAGNALTIEVDGLYAPEETLTGFAQGGLTPAGSRVYDYTAEDASVDGIVDGIHTLDLPAVGAAGIGPNYMVKEVSISAVSRNTLRVTSAPEVEHSAGLNAFIDVTPIPITAVGTFFGGIKGPYVFVNPFANRRAAIIPTESINYGYRKVSGNGNLNIDVFYERRYGAGAWNLVASTLYEYFGNDQLASVDDFWLSFMDLTNGPLAVGGSLTLSVRLGVNVFQGSPAGSAVYQHNGFVGVQYFGTL